MSSAGLHAVPPVKSRPANRGAFPETLPGGSYGFPAGIKPRELVNFTEEAI